MADIQATANRIVENVERDLPDFDAGEEKPQITQITQI